MYKLSFACLSHTGRIRAHNEDNFFFFGKYLKAEHQGSDLFIQKSTTAEMPLVGVFDGMGGEHCGELASYHPVVYLSKMAKPERWSESFFEEIYEEINNKVLREAVIQKVNMMGSTATILAFQDDEFWISDIGDSPAYLIRNGRMREITLAHTDEGIFHHSDGKPRLMQYLGLDPEDMSLEPYTSHEKVKTGDRLLVCSDGLTDMVSLERIQEIVQSFDIEKAIIELREEALRNGGKDNITIILCEVGEGNPEAYKEPEMPSPFHKEEIADISQKNLNSAYQAEESQAKTGILKVILPILLCLILVGGTIILFTNKNKPKEPQETEKPQETEEPVETEETEIDSENDTDDQENENEKDLPAYEKTEVISKVSAGDDYIVMLDSNGNILINSDNPDISPAFSMTEKCIDISAGDNHLLILKEDGTVTAAGDNSAGQCNVSEWTDIVSIAAGNDLSIGLKSDGTVVLTSNDFSMIGVKTWADIIGISCRNDHVVGLKSDGTVLAVGNNDNGQCNVSEWTDVISVSAGDQFTAGLKKDGTVIQIGKYYPDIYKVNQWSNVISISAGDGHIIGLCDDGTVVAAGSNDNGQCNVSDWTDIVAVAAGKDFSVGVRADGKIISTQQVNSKESETVEESIQNDDLNVFSDDSENSNED